MTEAMMTAGVGGYYEVEMEFYARPPAEVDVTQPMKDWVELIGTWNIVRWLLEDTSNWTLGDIAVEVERALGWAEDRDGRRMIDVWCSAVGENPDTVRELAWVSKMFPRREDRTGLTWTQCRTMVKAGGDAITAIETAVRRERTAARLAQELKNVQAAVKAGYDAITAMEEARKL